MEIPKFIPSKGKQWRVNFDKKKAFNFDDISSMENDEIREVVNKFYDEITPVIELVGEKFISYKSELIKLQEIN